MRPGGLRGVVGSGLGEGVEREVAVHLCPLVVLLGEDCADEADDARPVGEDAEDVGPAPDLAVEALLLPAFSPAF